MTADLNSNMLLELSACPHANCVRARDPYTHSRATFEGHLWGMRAAHETHQGKQCYVFSEACPTCYKVVAAFTPSDAQSPAICQCGNRIHYGDPGHWLDVHGLRGVIKFNKPKTSGGGLAGKNKVRQD